MLSRYPRLNQKLTSRLNWIFFFKTKKKLFQQIYFEEKFESKKKFHVVRKKFNQIENSSFEMKKEIATEH